MPSETRSLNQRALLWTATEGATGTDDYGVPKRSARATEIKCRWENRKAEMQDRDGATVMVDAVVAVDRDVPMGSYLWEGGWSSLWSDLSGTGTGTGSEWTADNDIMQVVAIRESKNTKGRVTRRELGLKRHGDVLPMKQ